MNKCKKLAFILLFLFFFLSLCNSTKIPNHDEKTKTQTLEIYALNAFHVFLCTMEIKNKLFLLK